MSWIEKFSRIRPHTQEVRGVYSVPKSTLQQEVIMKLLPLRYIDKLTPLAL